MSQLPASWTLTTLGKVCRIVSGSTPKTGEPRYWGGNIAWITPDDLSKNRSKRVRSGARSISHEGYESCSARLVPEGTVLFTSRAPIGYVAIADRELCTNQGFKSLVPSDAVSSDYLYWYMRFATPDVRSRASGTTFLEISGRGIAEVPIPLPPRAQQECIVDAIEEEFSRLEAGSTTLDGIEGRAARIVRQVLDAALQREQGISVDVASLITEPLANGRSVRDGYGYPVLRLDAINSGAVDLSRKKMGAWIGEEGRRFRVRVGDFLVVRGNGTLSLVGRGGLVAADAEVAYPDTLIRLRVDENRIDRRYLQLVWDSRSVRQQIERSARTTAGIYKINQRHIEGIALPLLPLDRQHALIEYLAVIRTANELGIAGVRRARKLSETLKSAVLGAAFAGRLA